MLTSAGNLLLRRSMEAALYWVIAIQFPIPLLHSHDQEISFDGSPSAHVRRHHGVGDADLGHWHWHCVLPWELGQEGKKPEDRDRLPILCAGSAESIAAIDLRSDIVDVAGLPQLVLPFAMHWRSPVGVHSPPGRNVGFMHSFMHVPLCALIGVSLR